MLTTELAVDPLLRGVFCGGIRGESNALMDGCDIEGADVPEARLSIDFRGLAKDISVGRKWPSPTAIVLIVVSRYLNMTKDNCSEAAQSRRLSPISLHHYRR